MILQSIFLVWCMLTTVIPSFASSETNLNPTRVRVELGDWRTKGKLDMFYGGHWGAVCARRWGRKEARVACKMLGYSGESVRPSTAYVYQHRSRLERSVHVLDRCHGDEESLDQCGEISRVYLCGMAPGHFLVGVDCDPELEDFVVYLDGHGLEAGGIVNVLEDGEHIRTICGDTWGQREATVVCRQLGISGTATALEVREEHLPRRSDHVIRMSGVDCRGVEDNLGHCVHHPWNDVRCEDKSRGKAAVLCGPAAKEFEVRLSNGQVYGEGWVQVKLMNRWADLVQPSWSGLEASAVCRMLGYRWGADRTSWFGRSRHNRAAWRFYGNCNGNEDHLLDCNITKWRLDNFGKENGENPTAVRCFNDTDAPSRPVIRGIPGNLLENGSVTVMCEANGGAFDVTAALQCPGASPDTPGPITMETGNHVTLSTSLLGRYAVLNAKPCACVSVNDRGWQATTERRPNIVYGPRHVQIVLPKKAPQAGGVFTLTCRAKLSNPQAEISWYNGTDFVSVPGHTYNVTTDEGLHSVKKWYIRAASRMTGNIITCLARNPQTNHTAFDTRVLVIGTQLPVQSHIGLASSNVFSFQSIMAGLQSSMGSLFQRS